MIRVTNYTNTTWAAMMNTLAAMWEWKRVVYDETDTSQVTQLWASDKVYFEVSGSNKRAMHTDGLEYKLTASAVINATTFTTAETDNVLLVGIAATSAAVGSAYLVISKTTDTQSTESAGIIAGVSNSLYMFSDNMTAATALGTSGFVKTSPANTQLVPAYSNVGDESFDGVFINFMRTQTALGKALLNGKSFYIYGDVSLAFEE